MRPEHLREGQIVVVKVAEIPGEVNGHPPFACTAEVLGYAHDDTWWVRLNTPAGPLEQMYKAQEIVGLWWEAAMTQRLPNPT
jgi:hypothetical protein